jgi:uroporphyrinogen decarboxylase
MRQAGRHLPEYRDLKKNYSFHELVKTPTLAAEVTLQPVRRYDMDAAIIFSDILVIPEALGQPYSFRAAGGIEMESAIRTASDIARLNTEGICDHLSYVAEAIARVRKELGQDKALIGFGGAPWTLATYMVEGGSSRDYRHAKELFFAHRDRFDRLMEKITEATIAYFSLQIEAGADALQIFDSWGGVLGPDIFWDASAKWILRIVDAIADRVPVIVYSKGSHDKLDLLVKTKPQILGVSWTTSLRDIRTQLPPNIGVQGNLDPVLMNTSPGLVIEATEKLLGEMKELPGFIFNLGHGVSPHAKPEVVKAMVDTVRGA